jgi:anti-sigma factor ChrR (cupin superfamily)
MMNRNLCIVLALGACASGAVYSTTHAVAAAEKHAFTPDAVPYGPAPAFIEKGAQLAVLEGDPMASSGDYTVRLKMPDGFRIAPHWHPQRENVTVLAGNLKLGMGDRFEEAGMMSLPAGSFGYLDPDMHHYVLTQGEVIVQIHGKSPVQFNYITASDDPSHRK